MGLIAKGREKREQRSADAAPAAAPGSQVYASAVLGIVPRLLSMLCRDRAQPGSLGCFDREHWAWKMRDIPEPTVQRAGQVLALLYARDLPGNLYHGKPQVRDWSLDALRYTIARQGKSGAWDQV